MPMPSSSKTWSNTYTCLPSLTSDLPYHYELSQKSGLLADIDDCPLDLFFSPFSGTIDFAGKATTSACLVVVCISQWPFPLEQPPLAAPCYIHVQNIHNIAQAGVFETPA